MYKAECIQEIKADFLESLARSELIPYEKSMEKGWFIRLASAIMRIFAPFL
jgi:hypothetical protein